PARVDVGGGDVAGAGAGVGENDLPAAVGVERGNVVGVIDHQRAGVDVGLGDGVAVGVGDGERAGAGFDQVVDADHRAGAAEGVILVRVVDGDGAGLNQPLDVDVGAVGAGV